MTPFTSLLNSRWLAQKYDMIELFAGEAWVSRAMRQSGRAVASLDINYHSCHDDRQNYMDLLTPAGFTHFGPKWFNSTCVLFPFIFEGWLGWIIHMVGEHWLVFFNSITLI